MNHDSFLLPPLPRGKDAVPNCWLSLPAVTVPLALAQLCSHTGKCPPNSDCSPKALLPAITEDGSAYSPPPSKSAVFQDV